METKNETRLRGMLGFAMRAGKVTIGTEMVFNAMRQGKIKLVLISAAASERTKKTISNKCEFYKVNTVTVDADTAELGRLLGKTYAPSAVGITDDGFAREIRLARESLAAERIERKEVSAPGNR